MRRGEQGKVFHSFQSDGTSRILSKVREELASYLYASRGVILEGLDLVEKRVRPFSSIVFLRVRTSSGVEKLVMKTVIHHPINEAITRRANQAVVEYCALEHLHKKFAEVDRCSVPKPVLLIPEYETYVMEFIEGRLLTEEFCHSRLFSSAGGFKKLKEHIFECGRWLKYLRDFTGLQSGGAGAFDEVRERAQSRLKLIELNGNGLIPARTLKAIGTSFSKLIEEASGGEVLICGRHGDFMPWNIIAGDNGITVIDFLGFKADVVAVDFYKMLIYLEDESRSLTADRRRLAELKDAFLGGYGGYPAVSRPVLLLCEAMQRIVSLWGHLSQRRSLPHHRIESKRCIRAHMNWLAEPA